MCYDDGTVCDHDDDDEVTIIFKHFFNSSFQDQKVLRKYVSSFVESCLPACLTLFCEFIQVLGWAGKLLFKTQSKQINFLE